MSYSSDPYGDQVRRDLERMHQEQQAYWRRQHQQIAQAEQESRDRMKAQDEQDYWDRRRRDSTQSGFPASGYVTYSSGGGSDGKSGLMFLLSVLGILALIAFGPYLAITLYYLADTWFMYHWIETVTLGTLYIMARGMAWGLAREARFTPGMEGSLAWANRLTSILRIAWVVVPLGLSAWTFFWSPPLEVAVQKMQARWDWWYSKEHFLFNSEDFKDSGEKGVQRLLQEISGPDAKLALVVESLRAIGPSGEKALQTEGAKRLLQAISNPDVNFEKLAGSLKGLGAQAATLETEGLPLLRKKLREDDKSFPGILRFCVIIGEPVFPVMREMANFKNPRSEQVLEAIAQMAPGTPGIEQFTPEIIQHCFYGDDDWVWSDSALSVLSIHGDYLAWDLRNFVPSDKFEAEGQRNALQLIRILNKESIADRTHGRYIFRIEAWDRKFRILRNLPPEPKY